MRKVNCWSVLAIVLVVSVFCLSKFATAQQHQGSWSFAYEHDDNGNRIGGNLQALISAVINGADVKVMVFYPDVRQTYIAEEVMIARNASLVALKSHTYSGTGGYPTLVEDRRGPMLIKTDGVVEYITYNASGTTIINHINDNFRMKWFVNR